MEFPQEQTVTVGGKTYRLSKLDLNTFGEWLAWAKTQLPDPFDRFEERFGHLSETLQTRAFDRAAKIAENRGTVHDPECMALMTTIPGARKAVQLMFAKYHPELTEEQVGEIFAAGIAEKGDAFTASMFPDSPKGKRKAAVKPV